MGNDKKENDSSGRPPALSAAVLSEGADHYVILPCDVADFGQFVSGLLGKQQKLTGLVEGTFDIGYQEITNIFHLVQERVTTQNDGSLTHFSVTVHYDNGTSITHNTVQDFRSYHPTEDRYPIGVTLSFTYLIKFRNRSAPEKQSIEASLFTEPTELAGRSFHSRYPDGSGFDYLVAYTDRTWATDIEGLLKNHAKTFMNKPGKTRTFIQRNSDEILSAISVVGWTLVAVAWMIVTGRHLEVISTSDPLTTATFSQVTSDIVRGVTVLGGLAAFLILLQKISEYNVFVRLRSYIVLVDRDRKKKQEGESSVFRRWMALFGTWISSIAASIVANFLTL